MKKFDHYTPADLTVEPDLSERSFVDYANGKVQKAIDSLQEPQRTVAVLQYFNGLKIPAIAESMDFSVQETQLISEQAKHLLCKKLAGLKNEMSVSK